MYLYRPAGYQAAAKPRSGATGTNPTSSQPQGGPRVSGTGGSRKRKAPTALGSEGAAEPQSGGAADPLLTADGAARGRESKEGPQAGVTYSEVVPVLEQPPKWGLLLDVLGEVHRERALLRAARPGATHPLLQSDAPAAERGPGGKSPGMERGQGGTGKGGMATGGGSDSDDEVQIVGEVAGAGVGRGLVAGRHRVPATATTAAATAATADTAGASGRASQVSGAPAGAVPPPQQGPSQHAADPCDHQPGPGTPNVLDESQAAGLQASGSGPVLVVVRELHMVRQLEQVVRLGGDAVMAAAYEAYLIRLRESKQATTSGRDSGGEGGGRRGRGRGGRCGAVYFTLRLAFLVTFCVSCVLSLWCQCAVDVAVHV